MNLFFNTNFQKFSAMVLLVGILGLAAGCDLGTYGKRMQESPVKPKSAVSDSLAPDGVPAADSEAEAAITPDPVE